ARARGGAVVPGLPRSRLFTPAVNHGGRWPSHNRTAMSDPHPGFTLPSLRAPLDAAAHIAAAPEWGSVKGLFFQDLVNVASAHGTVKSRQRYLPFLDYPLREYMDLLVACAGIVHPREPLRSGLRRLGRLAYPTFSKTLIGRAIFGVAGRDF